MSSWSSTPTPSDSPLWGTTAHAASGTALPWQIGDAHAWELACAGWCPQKTLGDTFLDAIASDPSLAWKNLKAGKMPKKVLDHWIHGYSKARTPSQDHGVFAAADEDGVGWDMPACAHYTGAGLVLPEQIGGDFDARVQFMCTHFAPGVALELAAIAVGPQRVMGRKDNPKGAGAKDGHDLVFDVHGTPPYVSAECDEDNGFRIGWNTSYTVTEFVPGALDNSRGMQAQSSNLFNAYGADKAPPLWPQPAQWHGLRLLRIGHQFACLFQPGCSGPWWCSGEVRHSAMPWAVHLRLAAKHWTKVANMAPATRVRFRHFELLQPETAPTTATPHRDSSLDSRGIA